MLVRKGNGNDQCGAFPFAMLGVEVRMTAKDK
jgi:hypothetical protein